MKLLYLILTAINLLGFVLMGYDKLKAKHKGWRIPELNLFAIALLGGAIGIFLGMKMFKHKTKHYVFIIGIPLLIGLNVVCVYFISLKL